MQTSNPLQMNDWEIKKFFMVIFSIQFAVWGFVVLDALKIQIPILRQLVCFIYLTFVPGILILRVLRLHKLGNIETVLYSVGLSLTSLMFIGFLVNILYPFIGILNPISRNYIIITVSVFVLVLSLLSYIKDRTFNYPELIDWGDVVNPMTLFLCLLPFLSIFAAYLMNYNNINILQMILLLIIASIPILILKWVPEKFFSFGIFIISISLLYHTSLISNYIWGADIQNEYYISNLVLTTSHWNMAIPERTNAMLSLVILAPVYSLILKISIPWIFKIIYPAIFSLIPLGLYKIFQKLTNAKIAFLSCFFFVSLSVFYTVMPALARQEIAELFFVLMIILILDTKMKKFNKSILLILFGISMIVSHYGISYIFAFLIILAGTISAIHYVLDNKKVSYTILNKNYLLIFIVFLLAWFMYVSSSSIFNVGVNIGDNILSSITDLFNPITSQGMAIVQGNFPLLQSIERYMYLISQGLITVGIIALLLNKLGNFNQEYKSFSLAAFIILVAGIVLPFFASTMNTDRIYHMCLLLLSPFFVIGFLMMVKILVRSKKSLSENQIKKSLYVLSIFLMIFFLLTSSFAYQLTDQPKVGRFALDNNVDFASFNTQEMATAEWLKSVNDPNIKIYGDSNKAWVLGSITGRSNDLTMCNFVNNRLVVGNSYIFISSFDTNNKEVSITERYGSSYIDYYLFNSLSKIQDSGNSSVLIS